MSYVVAHCRKVQTDVGLANVAEHNSRLDFYDKEWNPLGKLPDYMRNPEWAGANEGDRLTGAAVLKKRSDRIREAKLDRKPHKKAAAAIEIVLSASPDWFERNETGDAEAYFASCRKFIVERYGKENILHWATHFDEKTPHMHVLLVPLTTLKDQKSKKGEVKDRSVVRTEELRYSSSMFLGGRQGLRELQDELAAKVGKKYGMERGVEGSKARHTDQYQWAAENTKDRGVLAMERGALDIRSADLKKREGEVTRREREVARQEAALAEYKKKLEAWGQEREAQALAKEQLTVGEAKKQIMRGLSPTERATVEKMLNRGQER